MDGYSLWIRSPSGGLIHTPPLPAGEGTVLPTRKRLTPPECTAHRAPRTTSSPVCTNPACSTNQQAGCKQGAVGHPPPPRRAAHKKRHQNIWRFHMPKSTSK